ncbi:MAG: hypothetical protein AB9903_26725 [Vulcanimicrobiota bacterium]
MSNTTVNNNTSSYVGRELAGRIYQASSQCNSDDARLKTMVDGFDTIVKDTQTTKDEKELADFAKGFLGRLSSSPGKGKSISGFFKGLLHNNSDDIPLKARAGWAFIAALRSAESASYGSLMAEAQSDALSKLLSMKREDSKPLGKYDYRSPRDTQLLWSLKQVDDSQPLCLIDNGLNEIQNSTKTSQDEKTLAAFGTKMMKSASQDQIMARVAGSAFLSSIVTLNNGPVAAALMKAIQSGAYSFEDSSQAVVFMDKAIEGLMNDTLLSQDQKSLLTFGRDFSKKVSNIPLLQVAAEKEFFEAAGSSVNAQPLSVMAKAIYNAAFQSKYEGNKVEVVENGLREIIISPATSQREKALVASGKELMKTRNNDYGVELVTGEALVRAFASGNAGPAGQTIAKVMKEAVNKSELSSSVEIMNKGFKQLRCNGEITEKERELAGFEGNLSYIKNQDGNAVLFKAQSVLLDAIASGTDRSNMEIFVASVKEAMSVEIDKSNVNVKDHFLASALKALGEMPQASPAVRILAQNGAAREKFSDKMNAFQEIEKIVKGEPGITTALDRMANACDGEQHSGQIETTDDKVNIDGVKISRKSLNHMGYAVK